MSKPVGSGKSIQPDQGWVKIHGDILTLLAAAPLRGQQFRCLMYLFRQTYGYGKKEDKISLAQWAAGTGLKRQNVWRELQGLVAANVIYMRPNGVKRPATWGFNKYHEQWQFESVIADDDSSVIAHDYSSRATVIAHDDKSVITPHESTKERKKAASLLPADFLAAYEHIWGVTLVSPYIGEQIAAWAQRVTVDGWCYALEECVKAGKLGKWKYLESILWRIEQEGFAAAPAPDADAAVLPFVWEDIR